MFLIKLTAQLLRQELTVKALEQSLHIRPDSFTSW